MHDLSTCPRCGNTAFQHHLHVTDHHHTQESFEIKTCSNCQLAATTPRPAPGQISHYYSTDNYISHTNNSQNLQDRLYQWARRSAIRKKHRLIARHAGHGHLLDIGCGTGEFLSYLKSRGYQPQGVEPNQSAREQAIANHELPVVPDLESIPPHEQFQIVTLWHVLEHLYDPSRTLKQIHARSKNDALLVIAVPDRESWDAQHYGAAWAAYDVPRHLFHFRRSDIRDMLQQHGFRLLRVTPMWLDAPYVSLLSERYLGRAPITALILGACIGLWSNIRSCTSSKPTSSTLYIAQKAS